MWVAKLGGSLADAESLPAWLEALASRSDLVLVPGGGPFADQVRLAQDRWSFGDAAAHHLALLAMEQYGRMLCSLQPGLAPAVSSEQMLACSAAGRTPVWMPVDMALADPEIPQTWDMTSDSLAAWLAAQLGAEALILIKSAELPSGACSLEALAEEGIVDPLLPRFAAAADLPVHLLSVADPSALQRLQGLLSRGGARNPASTPQTAPPCPPPILSV